MIKSFIISVLLVIYFGTSYAQVHEISLKREKSKKSSILKSKSNDRYTFSHDFIYCKSKSTKDGSKFADIWLNGSFPNGLVGEPKIPAYKILILIHKGSIPTLRIVSNTEQIINLKDEGIVDPIYPNQPSVSKNQDSSKVGFVINKSSYLRKSYKNNAIATIEVLGNLRSATIARITVNPVDYNPVEGVLKVYNDIEIEVVSNDSKGSVENQLFDPKTYSPYFETIYKTLGQTNSAYTEHPDLTKYPVKMLVVCPDSLKTTIKPFIQWKVSKGFIIDTLYQNGATANQIKTFVQQKYNEATPESPAPTFLILVGDVELTPASATGTETGKKTDLYYASVDGDMFPEMYYGRLSAVNKNQLGNIINKIIYYEKYQFADPTYLNKTTLIAGVDGSGWTSKVGVPTIKYATANYFNASKGYTTVNEFGISSDPSNPSSNAGYTGCYSTEKIGTSFINYTAHGNEVSWVEPTLNNSSISTLSNTNKYPLVIGNCCLTGDFGYPECFGEAWIRAKDKGAVSYIGSSPNSFWYEDFYWSVGAFPMIGENNGYVPTFQETTTGAYDAPFVSNYVTLGGMLFAGNLAVTEVNLQGFKNSQASSDKYYWEGYNILGDPSLMPYFTEAALNQVTHNSTIIIGETSFKVNALANSYIAISKGGKLIGVAYALADGDVIVPISPITSTGDVSIVITRPRTIPVINTIQAINPTSVYLMLNSFTINDALANNNGKADYNETFKTNLTIKNIGVVNATNVGLKIEGNDVFISIQGVDSIGIPNIPFSEGTNTIILSDVFTFNTVQNVPDQHIANFTLKFYSDQGQWSSQLRIPINSPVLSISSIQINDNILGCDNDGLLNPGENCQLLVSLANNGNAKAKGVTLSISIPDSIKDVVTVSDIQNTPFDLSEKNSSTIPFSISVAASLRDELIIPIKLQANVVEPSGLTHLFEKQVEVTHKGVKMSTGSKTTCFSYFFDSGGKTENYGNGENSTFTFTAQNANSWLKLSILEFDIEEGYDYLYVYNGPNTSSPQISGSPFTGKTFPKNIFSTNGSLTFKFTSDENTVGKGWKATIECIEPIVPSCASNPKPTVAETLFKSTKLSWDATLLASFYDVYIGTESNNLTYQERVQIPEFTFIPKKSKTYYWRVKPGNSFGICNTDCNLWSFTTDTISIIEMSNNSVAVDTILFYDSGGPNSTYKNNESYTLTFKPRIPGQIINVSFINFDIETNATCNYDKLKIYDGLTTSSQLLGTFCGTNSPGLVKATNANGALTFSFESDKDIANSGWKAIVRSVMTTNTPITVDKKVRVFPNPFSDVINIDSDYPINRISIINNVGLVIVNKELANTNHERLSLAGIAPGVYILIIYIGNSVPEKTLIIKK